MGKVDMDDLYYAMFLEETREQIEKMEQSLLQLEQEHNNVEVINSIFRMAHSIKGAAATMELEEMAKLAHHLENLLDQIRDHRITVNPNIMNTFFKSVDSLKNMHHELSGMGKEAMDIQGIIGEIEEVIHNGGDYLSTSQGWPQEDQPAEENEEVILELDDKEKALCKDIQGQQDIYKLMIVLSKNTLMKSVKAFLVINNLLGIGDVIYTKPGDFEQISDEAFGNTFEILLTTDRDYESIYRNINSISEIQNIYIKKVQEGNRNKFNLPQNLRIMGDAEEGKKEEKSTVRVDVTKIDKLLNLVGEFIIDKESLMQIGNELKKKYKNDGQIHQLVNVLLHTNFIGSELQETVMSMRMLPLEHIFNRFPRMVRDLAQTCGKEVNFIMEGKGTDIDRGMIEALVDPLTHILRNAIDHGLETPEERKKKGKNPTGTLKLSARHEEGNVIIEIEDDGYGIDSNKIREKLIEKGMMTPEELRTLSDKEVIQQIFEAGFSTRKEVSDISGRGVGLDVVKSNIGKLNGMVEIQTVVGKGTKFIMRLPLTLAIIQALLIREGEYTFAIPISSIIETIRIKGSEIQEKIHRHGRFELFDWREQAIPLIRLGKYFEIEESSLEKNKNMIVIVGHSEKKFAFVVEQFLREQEIVVKSMSSFIGEHKLFGQLQGILGVSILGDGSFAQILDIATISGRQGDGYV